MRERDPPSAPCALPYRDRSSLRRRFQLGRHPWTNGVGDRLGNPGIPRHGPVDVLIGHCLIVGGMKEEHGVRPEPRPLGDEATRLLDALLPRRRQVPEMIVAEKNRLGFARDESIKRADRAEPPLR